MIVADELPPSVAAQVDWSAVAGLAIDAGSRTSHTAILARSLGIPTVVGLRHRDARPSRRVRWSHSTARRASSSSTPDERDLARSGGARRIARRSRRSIATPGRAPAVTRDGIRVRLEANVDRFEDVGAALATGAEGIGLFRSENLLLGGALPGLAGPASEARQAEAYRHVVAAMAPEPVTIRTFDIDEAQADALTAALPARSEVERHRPLGVRGIRLGLARPAMLETQLRAILRAASAGSVRILLPFVTSASELVAARGLLDEARAALTAEGVTVPRRSAGGDDRGARGGV